MLIVAAFLAATTGLSAQSGQTVRGDVDGDGRVTAADARIVADYLVGRPVPAGVDVAARGDANGDGRVTAADVAIISRFAAGRDVKRFPVGTPGLGGTPLAAVQCSANVRAKTVTCGAPQAAPGVRGLMLGNQHIYVELTSTNVASTPNGSNYDYTFDVTVKNLIPQTLGTTDGTTTDADSVRVFFSTPPTTTEGTGQVNVVGAGTSTFTATGQLYYQFPGPLPQNAVTPARTWRFQMPNTVVRFDFLVYVYGKVQFPEGWVDINPATHPSSPYLVPSRTVPPDTTLQFDYQVRHASGANDTATVTSWTSSGHGAATVSSTGVVTTTGAGVDTITAHSSRGRIGRFEVVVNSASAAKSTITASPDTLPVGSSSTITVQLKNNGGQNLNHSGGTVVLSTTAPAILSSDTATYIGNGAYTATLTTNNNVAGTFAVTGTLNGVPIGDTAQVTFTPGPAAQLAFVTQPSNTTAASPITPAVRVAIQDQYGNTITGATDNVTIAIGTNPAGGTLSGTATVAAVNGVATFADLSINKVGTGYTLTAASGSLTGATSQAFDVTAGAPAQLAFIVQPSNTAAGAHVTPAVQVAIEDAAGNVVPTATGNISVAIGTNPSGGTLSGTTTVAAVNGVATFADLSIDKTGTGYTLTASSGGVPGATSSAFDITPAAASKLVFSVQPSTTTSGAPITPAVQVTIQDQFGNTVTGSTDNVTIAIGTNPSGGTLSGTATVAAVNGVATFSNLSIDKAGTGYTLSATSGSLTGATSSAFNITPGAAAKLAFGQQPTNTAAGAANTPAVTVVIQDANGNTVPTATDNVTIAIGTNPSGGTLSGTATVAAVNGVATFSNLSIDKVGSGYTLAATSGSLTGATSTAFDVTPGAAASLAFTTQPSNTAAGAAITPAVQVTIRDAFGNTVTGASDNV
ncbi:MAG TPA: invasin domain 3-containing protein, partial [Longimicrobium sp.]